MASTDAHVSGFGGDADQRIDRRANTSPGPSQSKRDKKRQLLTDRFITLSEKFSRDRDMTYREQLQKIQIDTNLVMRLDPYTDRPLDFLGPDRHSRDREFNRDPDPDGRGGGRGLLEMAGPTFQQWIQEIEDLVEERDYELTKQKYDFEKKAQEHKNTHVFKTDTANREHKHLSATLRERLINAITAKKVRLTKEKEALEISDASALLLHPNQFSFANPSSPGGTHSKRATRLRQNADDIMGIGENRKRKRNGVDDDGSPAPQRRSGDTNGTTPFWHGDRLAYRKVTGPVYSIDKLFTDKELALTYNAAALASHKYLLSHRSKLDSNGDMVSSASDTESGDEDHDRDATPAAVTMERVPSHATRSTRGATHQPANFIDEKLVGLEALTNFEMPSNLEKLAANEPKMPPMFMSSYAKSHSKIDANTPATLSTDDVSSDLSVIRLLRQYEKLHGTGSNFDNANGGRKVLQATAFGPKDSRYLAYMRHEREDPEDLRKNLRLPSGNARDEPATPSGGSNGAPSATLHAAASMGTGASPMSRQSSQNGAAMSRQGSNTRAQRKRN